MTTRRDALTRIGIAMAAAGTGLGVPAVAGQDDDPLDEALRRLHSEEPRPRQGLSNHAPMVVEALCALGLAGRVLPWLSGYTSAAQPLAAPSAPIDPARWREALGPRRDTSSWEQANPRWGDWTLYFTAELASRPWREVLDTWVSRLAPGMSGAATHGVIRTAHAARGLGRKETPTRLAELARGLGYWASSYEELPSAPSLGAAAMTTFAGALAEVPLYRKAFGHSPEGRNIVEQLRHLQEIAAFAPVKDRIAVPSDLGAGLSALTATFTRVYLRHGTKEHTIAFVHAVTGPASLRRLAPHVTPATARAAFPYAWQAAAGIYAAYAPDHSEGRPEESRLAPEELAARAVANGDVHAIKFTEVMLAEHRIQPDPVYLAAAEDAIRRL